MKDLIFGLIGGTALLMYGVNKMGTGLEKAAGKMMKKILTVLTGKVWSAFIVGIILTALVQSSTAITVLTVGFVNAGLMNLSQATGIIFGANIGTTVTAQLMAVSVKFKLTEIALPILGIGFLISYSFKKETIKHLGDAIMGFGLMFLGLKILNGGVPIIQQSESIRYFFETYASIPIIAVLLGACATALVHSSSATIGLVLVLAQAGLLDLSSAVCIMLGDNIGTCVSAQLASLTGNINGRRTAWAHTLYNCFGVLLMAIFFKPFIALIQIITMNLQNSSDINLQIANSHTLFNIINSMIFLPLNKYYVKFLEKLIRERKNEVGFAPLDKLLLSTPIAALKASLSELIKATEISKEMVKHSMDCFFNNDDKTLNEINNNENILNSIQKDITSYMVELGKKPLSEAHSKMVPAFINSVNNVERAGDYAKEFITFINIKITRELSFSSESVKELRELEMVVMEMFDCTLKALGTNDPNLREKVKCLENKIDALSDTISQNHIRRLENGSCKVESGVILLDVVTHLERIADHIYKVCMIGTNELLDLSL
ncbi:Na/Pi cotransporter family protein [Clostridium rectalis]|uniref:Na/Pi cotransporter family protein n=1 Tax=Clostridium rectalis TaxID=2040295 RepID=UPI000F62DDEF|nr:Na/Pi cotransporter family protein [Clostridium rectalis]